MPPDFTRLFVLQTEASGSGIGAVLAQVIEGDEHPITYISRKLLEHKVNYSTVEKPCLAIKWAIHHLVEPPYLYAVALMRRFKES